LANAAGWVARRAGMWSFECRIRSWHADRRGTVQRWRRCSVATRPAPKIADTRAHFAPAQRQQECASRRPLNGRHVHGRSRRFPPPWSVEEKREAEESIGGDNGSVAGWDCCAKCSSITACCGFCGGGGGDPPKRPLGPFGIYMWAVVV
jgi:hypothetical protein